MAKSKAAKRKHLSRVDAPNKQPKTTAIITPPPDIPNFEPKNRQTVVPDDEVDITVETLTTLAQYPGLIKSKGCSDLRAAVYAFRQASNASSGAANITGRISAALSAADHIGARVLLAEMRIRNEELKLGALCRWVRDLDVISGLSPKPDGVDGERSAKNEEKLCLLDSILRVVGPVDDNVDAITRPRSPICLQKLWDLSGSSPRHQVYDSVLDKTIFESAPASLRSSLRIIETTPGPLRKPPNNYPGILYTSSPNAIPLSASSPDITHYTHPCVPRLSIAANVLTATECKAIIAAGESVNFLPDAPICEDGNTVVLAHNFCWIVDKAFHDAFWSRIARFVPASVDGRLVRGLNRRFRVYRYVPGAEYRCHIDGAWPPSGILPDDTYVYDDSPADQKQSSLFTFLVYLNDEFEGGETTFFLPAAKEGILNAYPVRPVMGSVVMFPHGTSEGALLHEGTGVRKGAKYIIRTDVEYDVLASDRSSTRP